MISFFLKPTPKYSIVGHLDDITQTLRIAPLALRHMYRYRQLTPWATEAGGQLFGTIDTGQICVVNVSGPYAGDERSRFCYRSDPVAAQRAIEERHRQGLLYLGEWHTHAEAHPNASSLDTDAMGRLTAFSQLNSSALLMLIVGQARGAAGLGVWSVSTASVQQWRLSETAEGG